MHTYVLFSFLSPPFSVLGFREVAETLPAMARLGSNDSLLAVAVYSHAHHWCHYSIVRWCLECKLFVRGFLALSFKRSIATSTFAMSQVRNMHIVRP